MPRRTFQHKIGYQTDTRNRHIRRYHQPSSIAPHAYPTQPSSPIRQGTQGIQGTQGTQGAQGTQGIQGRQGTQTHSNTGNSSLKAVRQISGNTWLTGHYYE